MKIRLTFFTAFRRLRRRDEPEGENSIQKRFRVQFLKGIRRDQQEQELFGSCLVLKNMAIVQQEMPLATDRILEVLADSSHVLRGIYEEILYLWRNGYGEAAFDILPERIGTRTARSFAYILARTDQINPSELVTAMRSFEDGLTGERTSRAMKRASRRSLITTAFASASVFAVLMNFTVVVVFMDMMRMLNGIGMG